jgi:hypothetical protein
MKRYGETHPSGMRPWCSGAGCVQQKGLEREFVPVSGEMDDTLQDRTDDGSLEGATAYK